ncbi:MAG TPA: hypothetical protein VHZ73_10815 [Vicinamibacterales bacterium]|nr:hypothetical protein [Vicinamibacterales bacterium]
MTREQSHIPLVVPGTNGASDVRNGDMTLRSVAFDAAGSHALLRYDAAADEVFDVVSLANP